MKTREEIEKILNAELYNSPVFTGEQKLLAELLLDIRDLLNSND